MFALPSSCNFLTAARWSSGPELRTRRQVQGPASHVSVHSNHLVGETTTSNFCQLWIFRLQPANIYCSASQNVTIALPLNNSHLFRCQAFVLSSIKDLLSSPVTRFLSAAACGQTDVSSRPPRAPHCPPPEVEPCNALLVGLRSTRRTARPPTVPPSSGWPPPSGNRTDGVLQDNLVAISPIKSGRLA